MATKKTVPKITLLKNKQSPKPNEETLHRERKTSAKLVELARLKVRHEYPTDELKRMLLGATEGRWAVLFEMERKYNTNNNPLLAWDAYIWARRYDLPIPPFVFEYLDASMEKLTATIPKGKEETRSHLVKSFGFSGRGQGSPFSRYLTMLEKHRIARAVLRKRKEYEKENKRTSWERIYKEVAKEWTDKKGKKISNENVKDIYLNLKGEIRNS